MTQFFLKKYFLIFNDTLINSFFFFTLTHLKAKTSTDFSLRELPRYIHNISLSTTLSEALLSPNSQHPKKTLEELLFKTV
jgi:hypothetical protein